MRIPTIILALSILLFSCDSETAFDCIKKTGITATQIIDVGSFDKIVLEDNIDLVILPGDTSVFIVSGKNLLPKISFETSNNILTIANTNKCNWTRQYTAATVYLSHPDIKEILLLGYGNLSSEDTLIINSLRIIALESPSDVDLTLSGFKLSISSNNISNFRLNGKVTELNAGFYSGDGIFDARNLKTENAYITHSGTNTMRINTRGLLEGSVNNVGNLEIFTAPYEIKMEVNGKGRIIKKY